VRAVMVQISGPLDQEQVLPPGDAVTTYAVITAPPFDNGSIHDTITELFAAVPVTEVGDPGAPFGVIGVDGDDAALSPVALVAFTVNV